MSAQPMERPESLEECAERIYNAQLVIKSLGETRDALSAQMAEQYRAIEDASYSLRLHLSETKQTEARVGRFSVAAKLDDKKLRVAEILIGATGEKRILPRQRTIRIVVREAKP